MKRLVAGLMWLMHWLPFRAIAWLGYGMGWLLYRVARSRRRVGETNLRLCFPTLSEAERQLILQQHFMALSCMLLEYGYCWFSPREQLKKLVQIEGLPLLQALAGQPVILVMPHFTGLDMAGLRVSLEVPVVSIYSKQKDEGLDAYVEQKRLRFDTGIVLSRQAGIRPALKALKQGFRFYYLPDQDFGMRDSVFAPFFGVSAATITGLSRLAKASGAQVLPCYPRRERDGYTLVIQPPLADFPSNDVQRDATRMNAVIESQVLQHAEQYFWLHKRFKTRPEGEPSVY
ncbi:LpxL/LpxP family acyltransferase [Chitinimonas sp. BJB300]|uniref:LpxL/LpxP family acyltransferase n=1 Tax=Chitinimonas sp. BJB300 TaxID=1559339 RepID=UPI000C0C7731|nr:lipid A biosynthesis acyltransferase [Chitinimonas sp. BJB300]PHV10248.1 lipid A biosynthesis acyltransferase [Chitinimonas sp. BJB300]TSJ91113.1 lipid A biosynthesis acyltransferase [Chitinimonas sp. BJB300]